MLNKIVATMLAMVMAIAVVGCNTVKGAGQDIKAGGEAISDTASDVSKKM